jgi:hypothetical protein
MIATVKLVRPDELLSLIREAADLPGPLWFSADAALERHNVGFWLIADIAIALTNVCFRGNSGHGGFTASCLLLIQSRHGGRPRARPPARSFDDVVSA